MPAEPKLNAQRTRTAASALQQQRRSAKSELPRSLEKDWVITDSDPMPADNKFVDQIRELFPHTKDVLLAKLGNGDPIEVKALKVGVVLSGGQAPGGHNVLAGVYDAVRRTGGSVIGFMDGPHGIYSGNYCKFDDNFVNMYRNMGGFDMIGSGRHKIESAEHMEASREIVEALDLDGLVVTGGDDSNTNAAILAEYFEGKGIKCRVVGVPKTIDGDLKCPPHIPVSFGFDTACRTFAELVGNICSDALSSQKYYHFGRLMGRSASNIALEVSLHTNPNICLIGEEVQSEKMSLHQLTVVVADVIVERSKVGKNYGVVLLPEGLIEFVPEFHALISEINEMGEGLTEDDVVSKLSEENRPRFEQLPGFFRHELLLDRDPHGNVQVAKIETEKLLASMVGIELDKRKEAGEYKGKFQPQFHAFGYEGRAGLPSRFDSAYCYSLGYTAGALIASGRTGLLSSVTNLAAPVSDWVCGGVPITSLCVIERRHRQDKPVIKKALVEMEGPMSWPYQAWKARRKRLAIEDHYRFPGPIQLASAYPVELPLTLSLELGENVQHLARTPVVTPFGKYLYNACASNISHFQKFRNNLPELIALPPAKKAKLTCGEITQPPRTVDHERITAAYPHLVNQPLVRMSEKPGEERSLEGKKVGLVFCGRPAPGGHDVVHGLSVSLCKGGKESAKLFGFVGGVEGFFGEHCVEITPDLAAAHKRTGGFDLLGRSKDSFAKEESLKKRAVEVCQNLGLCGLVLVGGTRTATDAVELAEYFAANSCDTAVVTVPSGIEGSLLNPFVEVPIGFDSAAKTICQLVGNTATDGASARKYYYFLRLMDGGSTGLNNTSHMSVEVGLACRPNVCLVGEDIARRDMTLKRVINYVADVICKRAEKKMDYGVIVCPEGLLASIPETRVLLSELEKLQFDGELSLEKLLPLMSTFSRSLFEELPSYIQLQLLKERGSNKGIQLTPIETERLLADWVGEELERRKKAGNYVGKFSPVCQFIGYQARGSVPSNFDSNYGFALGCVAAALGTSGYNGYMATASGLRNDPTKWRFAGAPITALMATNPDPSKGPFVPPKNVDETSSAWKAWKRIRVECEVDDMYENPGPIQIVGHAAEKVTESLEERARSWGETGNYLDTLDSLASKMQHIQEALRPGCVSRLARTAKNTLSTIEEIINMMKDEGERL